MSKQVTSLTIITMHYKHRFAGKKILFATVAGEKHVDPLTGLAEHLQKKGCDIKWYTAIKHYPLVSKEYHEDIKEIYKTFPFDMMIADSMFTAIPFVKKNMKIPAVAVGILPLSEKSKDLAPYGLGLTPANTMFERIKHSLLRFIYDKKNSRLFDFIIKNASLVLQSGTPGFEYYRSDIGKNIRFVGPLLPYAADFKRTAWFDERIKKYKKILLVTQGTAEKDVSKLIVPSLEAFKHTDVLVIVTTNGHQTAELRRRYPFDNVIIEDFIPFQDVMPYTSAFITNGGYAGVLLSIRHGLPIVAAGIHNSRNEICARIGFFKYGINLNTETPTPLQLRVAVEEITANNIYVRNVRRLSKEFELYNPNELSSGYIGELLNKN